LRRLPTHAGAGHDGSLGPEVGGEVEPRVLKGLARRDEGVGEPVRIAASSLEMRAFFVVAYLRAAVKPEPEVSRGDGPDARAAVAMPPEFGAVRAKRADDADR
jgi:hypothetical protein